MVYTGTYAHRLRPGQPLSILARPRVPPSTPFAAQLTPLPSYWQFLLTLTVSLLTLHLLLQPTLTTSNTYTSLLGAVALTIEATLPLPQLYSNWASQSCRGFRVSVLANWLVGDAMKMSYFFPQGNDSVTWPFKACGVFQALCDVGLGVQYAMYGDGPAAREVGEGMGIRMDEARGWEKGGS